MPEAQTPAPPDPILLRLVEFQVRRLQTTHADLIRNPGTAELAGFFFRRVYSTEDRIERDEYFRKLHDYFRTTLGEDIVANLAKLIRLNEMTDDMDHRMLVPLRRLLPEGADLTDEIYEEAYRNLDNFDERCEQVRTIDETVRFFHRLAHWPLVGLALRAVRAVAEARGARHFVDFLVEGHRAFRSVDDIEPFRRSVVDREAARNRRIFGR